ncbi:MAG: isocitrate/isopropylmalate family dehydrogenase, partial [Gammaproteobacteria bacterium]|nr:isocitrate/isopropylmalate family dehydrogenase [Gammaproteobacteria bacterium]
DCYNSNSGSAGVHQIGVLRGEGVGPEVVNAALAVLSAVQSISKATFQLHYGGCIGIESEKQIGSPLGEDVIGFCEDIWAGGGAILSGPGGGRYVYDLRKRFDLFCKLNPLITYGELGYAGHLKPEYTNDVDIMVVRENIAGVYQGQWSSGTTSDGTRSAAHRFEYTEDVVTRIVEVAARIASKRRGKLALIVKTNGVPTISELWLACGDQVAARYDVEVIPLEVDYAAYCMIQDAQELDVVVTPNLFGDILADLGGVLLGSRGLCYSGSFSRRGYAVYQTNHGAAYDLAGADRVNPVGQILSVAMMLRESFGLLRESALIEHAVRQVWRKGWRTPDLVDNGCRVCGTRDMAERVSDAVPPLAAQFT